MGPIFIILNMHSVAHRHAEMDGGAGGGGQLPLSSTREGGGGVGGRTCSPINKKIILLFVQYKYLAYNIFECFRNTFESQLLTNSSPVNCIFCISTKS